MNIKVWAAGASALVLVAASAAPAAAARMVVTYSGVLLNGFDQDGVFGPAATSLTGLTFTAVYHYDTAVGLRSTTPGVIDTLLGGSDAGVASPITYAGLTINGVAVQFLGTFSATASTSDALMQDSAATDGLHHNYLYNQVLDAGSPTNLEQSFSGAGDAGSLGDFKIYAPGHPMPYQATGSFLTDRVTVARNAVPEPAAWTLLIAGFGLAGVALRRRAFA